MIMLLHQLLHSFYAIENSKKQNKITATKTKQNKQQKQNKLLQVTFLLRFSHSDEVCKDRGIYLKRSRYKCKMT